MIRNWTNWKSFPDAQRGEHVEAPIGPGIYEVRHVATGDLAAFAAAANVAHALAELRRPSRPWARLFGARRTWRGHDLEYRTCAATTLGEARMMAEALLGRRQAYWSRTAPAAKAG